MKFMIDSISIEQIKEAIAYMPIEGVTSNPTIVKKTKPQDFFDHMRTIRKCIGQERSLHVQVLALDSETMVQEAHQIGKEIDKQVYIKVPVTYEGIKTIKVLKQEGYNVTATAIYEPLQAYMAVSAGADYIAPYVNRMANLGSDPMALIDQLSKQIQRDKYDCSIVGASFTNTKQIQEALLHGADAITASYEVLQMIFNNPSVDKAVHAFANDWQDVYGKNTLY